MTTEYNNCET